ncbi:phosphoribosyltransferase family protein [Streptomyces sp. NPDC048639]|uniref:phosphoribosyltransferase family protein n=1 Tax=Streptomyces sp. NPDC048639 TaxID=3365581 RepID=UPI0037196E97
MFTDRAEAGRLLAAELTHLRDESPVVLGLPRGGVPVAYEVARALGAPLDVILVRKLGVPSHRELGFGAIGEDGVRIVHEHIAAMSRADDDALAAVERAEEAELLRQAEQFRRGRERLPLEDRTAVVVDDGIATGATAAVACRVALAQGAERVVLAVPVAPPDAAENLRGTVDELVCLSTPAAFFAVGEWYEDFSQTADEEVVDLLDRRAADLEPQGAARAVDPPSPLSRDVEIPVMPDRVVLPGDLVLPPDATGIVVFAHGSGSSRHSPRNRAVAAALGEAGLGTLLFDLLTPEEERDRANVFDIETLARRLIAATRMVRREYGLPVGYFGASTGAAAALWAAADDAATAGATADTGMETGMETGMDPRTDIGTATGRDEAAGGEAPPGEPVFAVVSRGGRPDLAGPRLDGVRAPTLLIVGGLDETVVDVNRQAHARLMCENRLEVVPGATHLFEEPGAMETVCELARDWFLPHAKAHAGK